MGPFLSRLTFFSAIYELRTNLTLKILSKIQSLLPVPLCSAKIFPAPWTMSRYYHCFIDLQQISGIGAFVYPIEPFSAGLIEYFNRSSQIILG